MQRVRERVKAITAPRHRLPEAIEPIVAEVNRVVRGWAHYFSYGTRLMAYRAVDHYVWDRVRHFQRRRRKVPTRGTKRFSADVVFGELGVFQLRRFHLKPPVHARV